MSASRGSAYTAAQRQALLRALRETRRATGPECPACGGTLTVEELPPSRQVPYVRDRVCYTCGTCSRSAVLDRREIERSAR